MKHVSTSTTLAASSAVSRHVDAVMAAEQACESILAAGPESIDLLMMFVSGAHVKEMEEMASLIRAQLAPGTLVGVSAGGVVGVGEEIEDDAALSVFAASLPGTELHTFRYQDLPHAESEDDDGLSDLAEAMGAARDLRATFFFADPFSVPAASIVQSMSAAIGASSRGEPPPIIGGIASVSATPGSNVLVLNDEVMRVGAVGVSVRGDVEIDTLVSQGCRPIDKPFVITGAQRNIVKTLGGRKAIEVLHEVVTGLPQEDREKLSNGLFIGRVINEYKDRFGRGDFLIRNVLGVDQRSGHLAVGDMVRVGQTVQFHLRDALTASEDLKLLLAGQELKSPPVGGLLFTCNGRGEGLFGEADHDAKAVSDVLTGGGGAAGGPMPLAGFFAGGEIGPVGGTSFLHGHTASLALFRPRVRR